MGGCMSTAGWIGVWEFWVRVELFKITLSNYLAICAQIDLVKAEDGRYT